MATLPNDVLERVLAMAGPHALLVCREWRDIMARPDVMADALTIEFGAGPALLLSARRGRLGVVRVLRRGKAKANDVYDVWQALLAATENGHEAVVRLLYVEKLQVLEIPELLLWSASKNGHENIASALLDWPHRAPKADCLEGSVLFDAIKNGHEGVVRLLLTRQHFSEYLYAAAYSLAAERGHDRIVRLMQARQLPVEQHYVALDLAARGGHKATVRLLLDSHETPAEIRDRAWRSATEHGYTSVARLLRRRRACALM